MHVYSGGEYVHAKPLLQKAYDDAVAVMGEMHRDTIEILGYLGEIYDRDGAAPILGGVDPTFGC